MPGIDNLGRGGSSNERRSIGAESFIQGLGFRVQSLDTKATSNFGHISSSFLTSRLLLTVHASQAKLLLMDKILHDPKDPKLWELWYIPYNG